MGKQVITATHVDYVYRILDREQELFWSNPRGKRVWNKPAHAMRSWELAHSGWRAATNTKFTQQTRYVVRKYRLTYVEEV